MFLERLLAPLVRSGGSLNNPALSLSDPATWDGLWDGGGSSDAGVQVSPVRALGVAAVWQCVSMISADVAKLPLNKYVRNAQSEDDRTIAAGDPVQTLVRRRANDEQSAFRVWRRLLVHALLWGNGYAYIDRDGRGRPLQIINLLPDRTAPERVGGTLRYVTETTTREGSPWLRPLDAHDVLHIQGLSIEGDRGCEIVHAARNAFGLAIAIQKFAAKFFKNGVRTGGILEIPAGMKPNTADKVEEGFRKQYTGEDNWFKSVILRDGCKFHQTSVPPDDGQMTESREEQVREVARYFNVAPSRLGLSDSVSYNSKAEDNQAYLDSTLSPWLQEITGECDAKLLTPEEIRGQTHFFEHNVNALLRMNALQRYQVYAIGVRNRILLPNDCRRAENLPPLKGGDEFPPATGPGAAQSAGGSDKGGATPPRGPADATGGAGDPPPTGQE